MAWPTTTGTATRCRRVPREAIPQALQDLGLFDHPDVQKNFVRPVGEHEQEAALILEGITCAACVWLNEQHIARQPGVTAVDINYATRRARVRWDERRIRLSQILEAIAAIGYRAHPYDAARSELLAQKERRGALWRLFVAGFGMMQVMMYAIPVYLAEEGTMTPDIEQLMRWASLVLTLPVIVLLGGAVLSQRLARSAVPPHRHGRAGGAGRRRRLSGQRLGDADRGGRGLFRFGHHVRVLPAWWPLPGDGGAPEGGARRRGAGARPAGLCRALCRLSGR